MSARKRIGIFGWGVVAPRCKNIGEFEARLHSADSWLVDFNGFAASNFLAGSPAFALETYQPWIDARFPPTTYLQLKRKLDNTSLFGIGAFIQSLQQNPGIEKTLQELSSRAHVYVGTSMGSIPTLYQASIQLHQLICQWDAFWADPSRNEPLRNYLSLLQNHSGPRLENVQANLPSRDDREEWNRYWASRSPLLAEFLMASARIDNYAVPVKDTNGTTASLVERHRRHEQLRASYNAPIPPWRSSESIFWNLHNTPAAEISILGKIKGLSYAPVGACSTFGLALALAVKAIRSGGATVVVVGATDPDPHPLTVSAFHAVKVLAADGSVSLPLTKFHGTHLSGGAAIWIVADYDDFIARGYEPLGMEICGVGLSSDAQHLITPSCDGPQMAIREALDDAGITADLVGTWDLHATGTPGDWAEVRNLLDILPPSVTTTARKGMFGHGLAVAGGWELTAQHLGGSKGILYPTPLTSDSLSPDIRAVHKECMFDQAREWPQGYAGKLSMGLGGINACIISKPWGARQEAIRR